ncbi:hypothetical protein [Terriglobus saanensis]|uniref:Lipoprotein n=1 Tax=Terriglobus saanensis (strain ATCC BAA-1853 / DSM 23119 / SP1PR4) TaxID=401053 RepID=E8V6K6_TERSS|nr:hypothetical protein [Terriglobus saanensis]ADV82745.1 hypothetical protein AciPR4_1941 [Terriglobus saanensis SP1PR4]
MRPFRTLLNATLLATCLAGASCMVGQQGSAFVVGRETATDGLIRPFEKTHLELPKDPLNEMDRRQLVRMMYAELGFARRPLPVGAPGVILFANGSLKPEASEMRKRLYEKGISSNQGDRIQITDVQVRPDHIIFDINGGPYVKHRFLRHFEINGVSMGLDPYEKATGSRIILQFEGPVPDLSAAEVKLLLEPILDFGVKSSTEAFAETLPPLIRAAVETHEVLVGMTRRMVIASLGQPEIKMRERPAGGVDGEVSEEWIYGKVPQTMRFVRFEGDRVVLLKIAALGKPLDIHDKDEMAGYRPPKQEHVVALGDTHPTLGQDTEAPRAPSLQTDAEQKSSNGVGLGKVDLPTNKSGDAKVPASAPEDAAKHLIM